MKKLQIIAWICFSLSCYSMGTRDVFLKLPNNEYMQYHYEPLAGNPKISIGHITPTRVKTYGEINPDKIKMSNIQAINYTISRVNLFKDLSNNCCIDIYESNITPNKCRIVGINGRNVHIELPEMKGDTVFGVNEQDIRIKSYCFSIYDVSIREKSFVEDENKLIFVDNSGTYIVSAAQNPIDTVIDTYIERREFDFNGSVIRISAIYGDLLANGLPITPYDFSNDVSYVQSPQNLETKPVGTFLLNCSRQMPVFIGTTFAPVTKLYPAMQQIEKITDVKLINPPPSEKSVIKRISDILGLGIIANILTIKDGEVCLVNVAPAALRKEIPGVNPDIGDWDEFDTALLFSYIYPLQNFISTTDQNIQWADYTVPCLSIHSAVKEGSIKGYIFDISPEAIINRKIIAAQPWDNI